MRLALYPGLYIFFNVSRLKNREGLVDFHDVMAVVYRMTLFRMNHCTVVTTTELLPKPNFNYPVSFLFVSDDRTSSTAPSTETCHVMCESNMYNCL